MRTRKPRTSYLPYLVAILGVLVTFTAWLILREQLPTYYRIYATIKTLHPWMDLILDTTAAILVGVVIGFMELARENTKALERINEELEREIAERKTAQESEKKLEAALMQGQKLQAIGTLAGGIAHDFNNILYAVIGYIELSKEDVPKDSQVYKNLSKVLDAAHRGQELVSRILAFSRRQHYQHDALDLNHTIEAVLSLLKPTIPASVDIIFKPGPEISILGNQNQIHQVIVNLITNAVDAMDDTGAIVVATSKVLKDDSILKNFPQTLPQNYCKIDITDTGHGMDQATMERIFEPFFTTKEVGKGTGLGLSIVHSIVKEHQGEITVSSQPGEGSTFTLLLPELLSP